MIEPFGPNTNRSTTLLNDLLDDCQPKSDAFMVHLCSTVQFTKATEKFWEIFLSNSNACVFYMNN